jgi:hypothetical protein
MFQQDTRPRPVRAVRSHTVHFAALNAGVGGGTAPSMLRHSISE